MIRTSSIGKLKHVTDILVFALNLNPSWAFMWALIIRWCGEFIMPLGGDADRVSRLQCIPNSGDCVAFPGTDKFCEHCLQKLLFQNTCPVAATGVKILKGLVKNIQEFRAWIHWPGKSCVCP
jgi:hypothetical protein